MKFRLSQTTNYKLPATRTRFAGLSPLLNRVGIGVGIVGIVGGVGIVGTMAWQAAVEAASWTTITQRSGVIQNDQNGTILTAHTAQVGERMRVRLQIDTNAGDDPKQAVFKLQYDKNDNNWSDVRPAGDIRPARSEIVGLSSTIGTGESGSCQGGTTKTPGFQANQSARTKALTINPSTCKDIGFIVDTKNATTNTQYRFRLYNLTDDSTLNSYAAYASFTTVDSANDTLKMSKSNVPSLSSGYDDLKTLLDSQGYSNAEADDVAREILQNVSGDTTADVVMDGEADLEEEQFGRSVASAGDVNGDGYEDVIVGAPGHFLGSGAAYIYLGGTAFNSIPFIVLTEPGGNSSFGYSVASAGDINDDGYADVIVGSPFVGTGMPLEGKSFIYYGGANMDTTADVVMTGEATNNYFGYSVAPAGDVNGDGYDDVIVGADGYSTDTGRAYIYYGGPSMDNTADVVMTGEASNNYFGHSVASAGDVNGDGYGDVIVGAYRYSSFTGRAYIYYGGPSMDTTADVVMTGEATSNNFGYSVAPAGDVNGDGYADVIVGANGYSSNTGRAYIYYGGPSMDNTADVVMTGETTSNYFGISVASAGDVNGDGYADVIVGANRYATYTGRVYTYHGGSSMNNTADVTMTGEANNNRYGSSVANLGDVNGDGFADIGVGAYGYGSNVGRVYVYYQSQAMNDVADAVANGEATGNYFGNSTVVLGDVNGDGYDDWAVGAYGYNTNTGRVYVYFGGSPLSSTADLMLTGEATNNYFGRSLSRVGDMNGDGYDDIIIAADGYNSNVGRAYVYYGGPSIDATPDKILANTVPGGSRMGYQMAGLGDVNGDGYNDVAFYGSAGGLFHGFIVLLGGADMDDAADLTIVGLSANAPLAGAGDVNGDGYDDIIAGNPAYSSNTGQVLVYYGGPVLDGTVDLTLTGETANSYFGYSVAGRGDVNGDGYDDIVVGADRYSTNSGRIYLYHGGPSMDNIADASSTGIIGLYLGTSLSISGDVNGDGYNDIVAGGRATSGRVHVYFGRPNYSSSPYVTEDMIMTSAGSSQFGTSVAVGDINGDGYADVIGGAPLVTTNTGRADVFLGGRSDQVPVITKAIKASEACSALDSISATWNGQSNVGASAKNIVLQAYRFGSTNAWETVTTNSSLAVDTDGDVTGSASSNLGEYCDGDNWTYWRVYQQSGTNTLHTDLFNIELAGDGDSGPTPTPTPQMNQRLQGGNWWNDNLRQFLHLD